MAPFIHDYSAFDATPTSRPLFRHDFRITRNAAIIPTPPRPMVMATDMGRLVQGVRQNDRHTYVLTDISAFLVTAEWNRRRQRHSEMAMAPLLRRPSMGVRPYGRDLSIRPLLAILSYDYGRYFVWNITLLIRLSSSVSWDYHEFWMSGCVVRPSTTRRHGRVFLQFDRAVNADMAVDGFLLIWE